MLPCAQRSAAVRMGLAIPRKAACCWRRRRTARAHACPCGKSEDLIRNSIVVRFSSFVTYLCFLVMVLNPVFADGVCIRGDGIEPGANPPEVTRGNIRRHVGFIVVGESAFDRFDDPIKQRHFPARVFHATIFG